MLINGTHFQQKYDLYCLRVKVKFYTIQYFVDFFETLSDSISYFEAEETNNIDSQPNDLWQIEVYLHKKPNLASINKQLKKIIAENNFEEVELSYEQVESKDWVQESQQSFTPIEADLFFIHSKNYTEEIPQDKIQITLEAGCAFGTGEHETTKNCLLALCELKENKFINCLDLGTGSGILAIAIAKLWPNQVTAADIDNQAVLVARDNFHNNRVGFISCEVSDGYNSEFILNNSKYQLITANILANPLIEMAEAAYNNLHHNGYLIIAGFLNAQKTKVLKAHQLVGFKLITEIVKNEWPALILQKP